MQWKSVPGAQRAAGVVLVILASLSAALPATQVDTTEEGAASSRGLFRLRSADENLVILDWDRPAVRIAAAQPRPHLLRGFPLRPGLSVDLEIRPFSVTGPGTRFVRGRRGGEDEPIDFDPATISLFRGRVLGRPGSHVFLAISEKRSTGTIDLGDGGELYRISSIGGSGATLQAGRTSVFETPVAASAPPDVPFCAVEPYVTAPADISTRAGGTREASGPLKGLKHVELAVETDYEYFVLFGDTTDALTYLTEMYAQVSDIYIRDVDTRIELVFARIWDDPNDLFNIVEPSPLGDFQDYWNTNMGAVNRDVAQLFSGRRDYPFGGQAYLSALCGSNGYSVVGYAQGSFPDPTRPSPYNYDISVTAHEIGHNAGTGHTQDNGIDTCHDPLTTAQRGSIMSYCGQTWSGGNSNRDLYFHSVIQGNMDAHINGVSCVIDDCNVNGVADGSDISGGTSQDLNSNGIPDECEDCNGNLVLDNLDIAGASLDVDGNGVPDECQPDCNSNNVPDRKDIADGTSLDAYGDDIPDECEADCNSNGTSDYTEIQLNMPLDIDRNAILDSCQDCDTDDTPDMTVLGPAHRAWVASGLANSPIREFHPTTGVLARTSAGGGAALADEAQDLLVVPGDRILVASAADHRVMEFDTDGNYLGDLVPSGVGGLTHPTGMALTPDGTTLLVASRDTDSVLSYDEGTGASLGAFVSSGSGGLAAPFGLAFGPNGALFVAGDDDQIREYDGGTGAFVRIFVSAAANGGLSQPRAIAFKPDGDLLVTSFGTDQTLAFDGNTGASLGRWALSGTSDRLTQISPWGLRVGPNGNVFIVRTGEAFGSGGSGAHDHESADGGGISPLHLTNAQIYEFDATNGNFLRAYINGNDHGMEFPSGFDFVPGWDIDCNFNMLPDDCDIAGGFSDDLDSSGVPDECETDCDGNGTWDRLDIIPYGPALDCNGNLVPDGCDAAGGFSADCTGNGIPDECEVDCNDNGVADSCDIDAGTSEDCNGNGIPDECDIFDDLETDTGWTVGFAGDTASTGVWTRVDPVGTGAQPEDDHTVAGTQAFVTGQGAVGGGVGSADVDGGATTLISPLLDLSNLGGDVELGYWRWFSNNQGGAPEEDEFVVRISDDGGGTWATVETVGPTGPEVSGGWFFHRFRVADFATPTATVMLQFIASDTGSGSIVEAAIDDLGIFGACCQTSLDCDDGLACTVDTCNPGGDCSSSVAMGSCLIGGFCHAQGDPNPGDDCEECDDASPFAWTPAPATEVEGVLLSPGGPTQLDWTAQGAALYDIAGDAVSAMRAAGSVDGAQCLADDVVAPTWTDPRADPAAGAIYYYLVRAQKSCGSGTYGLTSAGAGRAPAADCP